MMNLSEVDNLLQEFLSAEPPRKWEIYLKFLNNDLRWIASMQRLLIEKEVKENSSWSAWYKATLEEFNHSDFSGSTEGDR